MISLVSRILQELASSKEGVSRLALNEAIFPHISEEDARNAYEISLRAHQKAIGRKIPRPSVDEQIRQGRHNLLTRTLSDLERRLSLIKRDRKLRGIHATWSLTSAGLSHLNESEVIGMAGKAGSKKKAPKQGTKKKSAAKKDKAAA